MISLNLARVELISTIDIRYANNDTDTVIFAATKRFFFIATLFCLPVLRPNEQRLIMSELLTEVYAIFSSENGAGAP